MTITVIQRPDVARVALTAEPGSLEPDVLSELVQTAGENLLEGLAQVGLAADWSTMAINIEERPQPATSPAAPSYVSIVATVEILA